VVWEDISDEAKDLIKGLLCDYEERYSTEDCLSHPWIMEKGLLLKKQSKITHSETSAKIIDRMKSFKQTKKLKKAVMTYIATRADTDYVREMQKAFLRMDKKKHGGIKIADFIKSLETREDAKDLKRISAAMDTDHNGVISYTGNSKTLLCRILDCHIEQRYL
jgi:hypothetical protein